MSYATRHTVEITTDGDGAATAYTDNVTGAIRLAKYDKTDFADGVDFLITSETTGQTIWDEDDVNTDKSISPRQALHSNAGVALTYDNTEPVAGDIVLAEERIKIVIASGGDTKTGAFTFVVQ